MNEPLEAVTGPPADERVRAMTTRVFLALAPPDDAKDELAQALRPAYDAYPRMRWNRIEDWHITLAFLGELPVAAVPPLMPPLAGLASGRRPLRLALHGGGHFDERVLWTGVTGDLEGLHHLATDVRALVRECGVSFPERPLRPHLTLARSRRGDHAATVAAAEGLAAFAGRSWEAGRLHLVGSNIGRGPGPIHYRDIEAWDFRHGTDGPEEILPEA
ncbi:RNA 2',3'-cyclic phosphodiesterase [Streptomyces anulatus]|uniref:RNA 2',3'-cyclic phosphodiesterase n=1 Tax=Streptomyces anulatus TaxID=1892 RepID=UPI00386D9863